MHRLRRVASGLLLLVATGCASGGGDAAAPTTTRPAPALGALDPVERELHDLLGSVGLGELIGESPVRCLAHAAVTDLGPGPAAAFVAGYVGRSPQTAEAAGTIAALLAACAGSEALAEVMATNMEAKSLSELTPVQLRCTFSRLIDALGPSAAGSFGSRMPVPRADAAAWARAHRSCGALREMAARAFARTEAADVAACAAESVDEDALEAYVAASLTGDEAERRSRSGPLERSVNRCKATLSK